jgi:hypothetical protein
MGADQEIDSHGVGPVNPSETSLTKANQAVWSSPSRGAIFFLQLTNHCPARALVESGVRDRWSPGGKSGGAIPIYEATPKDGRCMSDFGGGADVQQIRVIALVTITVLPLGSANSGRSRYSCELLKSSISCRSHPVIVFC